MSLLIKFFLPVFLVIGLVGCTASPTQESAGQFIDSSTLTARVKAELIDKLGTDGFSVKVKTYKDEVQLAGFVDSTIIKKRAADIAANVIGVKRVRNALIVK